MSSKKSKKKCVKTWCKKGQKTSKNAKKICNKQCQPVLLPTAPPTGTPLICGQPQAEVLVLKEEIKFQNLLGGNSKGQTKFEASDIVIAGPVAYAVHDNAWAITAFDAENFSAPRWSQQVGRPDHEKFSSNPGNNGDPQSDYEGLAMDSETGDLYAVMESKKHTWSDNKYRAVIQHIPNPNLDDDFTVVDECSTEKEFEGDSKGLEGAVVIRDLDDEVVIIGLCEGNHCSESRKDDRGNGRLAAMRRVNLPSGGCQWSTIKEILIPSSADFLDYSAIAVDEQTGRVAITSQAESKMWVGQLTGRQGNGLYDIDGTSLDDSASTVYDFPKDQNCDVMYCNIEGLSWLPDGNIMAVSDKAKSSQNSTCRAKEQSAHIFVLP